MAGLNDLKISRIYKDNNWPSASGNPGLGVAGTENKVAINTINLRI
jgi:hypothetical protein